MTEPIRPQWNSFRTWPPRLSVSRCSFSPDAKGKWGCELNSSEETSGRKLTGGFRLAVVLVALCCVAVLGYMAGVRQPHSDAGEPPKTYELKFGQAGIHLTVGAMGVAVIFTVTILLAAAVLLAAVASRRRRQSEAANRELTNEITVRNQAEQALARQAEELFPLATGLGSPDAHAPVRPGQYGRGVGRR